MHLKSIIVCFALSAYPSTVWSSSEWDISSVQEIQSDYPTGGTTRQSKISFTNEVDFIIPLHASTPIAVLNRGDGSAYLAALGRNCVQCDENLAIHFFALSKPHITQIAGRFLNAGTISDYMPPHEELHRVRVFAGACVAVPSEVVLWYHEYRTEDGDYIQTKYFTSFENGGVQLVQISPEEESQLLKTSAAECSELQGSDRISEP